MFVASGFGSEGGSRHSVLAPVRCDSWPLQPRRVVRAHARWPVRKWRHDDCPPYVARCYGSRDGALRNHYSHVPARFGAVRECSSGACETAVARTGISVVHDCQSASTGVALNVQKGAQLQLAEYRAKRLASCECVVLQHNRVIRIPEPAYVVRVETFLEAVPCAQCFHQDRRARGAGSSSLLEAESNGLPHTPTILVRYTASPNHQTYDALHRSCANSPE